MAAQNPGPGYQPSDEVEYDDEIQDELLDEFAKKFDISEKTSVKKTPVKETYVGQRFFKYAKKFLSIQGPHVIAVKKGEFMILEQLVPSGKFVFSFGSYKEIDGKFVSRISFCNSFTKIDFAYVKSSKMYINHTITVDFSSRKIAEYFLAEMLSFVRRQEVKEAKRVKKHAKE